MRAVAAWWCAPWVVGGVTTTARAAGQPPKIGVLLFNDASDASKAGFRQGMKELGYREGENIVVEWRSAEGRPERAPALAAELVRANVDVIVAEFTPMVVAAKNATRTIPIVMAPAGDPVATGLVASLARPGGNVTGFTNSAAELAGKRLELLKRIAPDLAVVGLLIGGSDPLDASFVAETEAAAKASGMQVRVVRVARFDDAPTAFVQLAKLHAQAVVVPGNLPVPFTRVAELAATNKLPSISLFSQYPQAGGLMSYGTSAADLQRRSIGHLDKILRGTKPQDLPVERPTKFELVVNKGVAGRLGIALPASMLVQADAVID